MKGLKMNWIALIGMLLALVVTPGMTFLFIWAIKKNKANVEIARYRKEILELEVEKEELKLKVFQEENKKLDRLIEHKIDFSPERPLKVWKFEVNANLTYSTMPARLLPGYTVANLTLLTGITFTPELMTR
jgi:hypothetical protein